MEETVFFKGEEYFQSLLRDLAEARKSIELESYIFKLDNLGKELISALTQAAKRGVRVRLVVDGAGTPEWKGAAIKQLELSGVETRVFHPFPWRFWQWSRAHLRMAFLLKVIYFILKINARNHRKVCIIDSEIVYVGSFNITMQHLNKEQSGDGWRDTGIRLRYLELHDLEEAFEAIWTHIPIQERVQHFFRHIKTNPVIRLNNTRHRRRILYKNLLKRLQSCKHRIWITNAYFIPDNLLLRRLIEAAKAGCDVRILLPQKSDVIFMPWAAQTFYTKLLQAGVRVFEYTASILHAKTLILDNWMTIGSSNMNYRSFRHDLEIDVKVRLPATKQLLLQQFLRDLANSKEIFCQAWLRRPWYQTIIGKLILYLKYLI